MVEVQVGCERFSGPRHRFKPRTRSLLTTLTQFRTSSKSVAQRPALFANSALRSALGKVPHFLPTLHFVVRAERSSGLFRSCWVWIVAPSESLPFGYEFINPFARPSGWTRRNVPIQRQVMCSSKCIFALSVGSLSVSFWVGRCHFRVPRSHYRSMGDAVVVKAARRPENGPKDVVVDA
jgi:hypothetical protein